MYYFFPNDENPTEITKFVPLYLQEAHERAEGAPDVVRGFRHWELPLEVDGTIREDAVESEESVSTGDQEAWVSCFAVYPCAVGDGCEPTARRHHHTERGRGRAESGVS